MSQDFLESRRNYRKLFRILKDEAFGEKPDMLRHPLVFYFAHTVAFTRCKLLEAGVKMEKHDFDTLFERGVSPDFEGDVPSLEFPEMALVGKYISEFRALVYKLIIDTKLNDRQKYALKMGIEHERLHLQTSVPLIMQLDTRFIKNLSLDLEDSDFEKVEMEFRNVQGGLVKYGSGHFVESLDKFMWDNEQGIEEFELGDFSVSRYPITNTQVVDFLENGGYESVEFWKEDDESLSWFENFGCKKAVPFNFRKNNTGGYDYRMIDTWINSIPLALPAMLNHHEAGAVARFLGGRMISEAEWMQIHQGLEYGNVGFEKFRPVDVREFEDFEIGNVACWTRGGFGKLGEGEFVVSDLYPEFSREWFNKKHAVLKGVSFAGSGHMLDCEFRDFMQKVMYYPASTYVVKNK